MHLCAATKFETMGTMDKANLSPVDIARLALSRLSHNKLPPTPENYAAHYREIAGLPANGPDAPGQLLEMARALLQAISVANDDLSQDLGRFDSEARQLLNDAQDNEDPETLKEILGAMTASSSWLLSQVAGARAELDRTREQLDIAHKQLDQAQYDALTDPLTRIPNRRGLDNALPREIARAKRTRSPLCVALIDLDHFKKINDEHGHDAGDRALRHFAQLAKPALRETDMIGRWGGEEFVVVLPDTSADGAVITMTRLARLLEQKPLVIGQAQVQLIIRFSAGVAAWELGESVEHVVGRADQAAYAAKKAGRGRTVVADPLPPMADVAKPRAAAS
jgi:diguanylate cyclase